MTNADKIRQMNDIELANYLDSIQFFGYLAGKDDTKLIYINIYEWFEWLIKEVKETGLLNIMSA